jgi:hypothetical protein
MGWFRRGVRSPRPIARQGIRRHAYTRDDGGRGKTSSTRGRRASLAGVISSAQMALKISSRFASPGLLLGPAYRATGVLRFVQLRQELRGRQVEDGVSRESSLGSEGFEDSPPVDWFDDSLTVFFFAPPVGRNPHSSSTARATSSSEARGGHLVHRVPRHLGMFDAQAQPQRERRRRRAAQVCVQLGHPHAELARGDEIQRLLHERDRNLRGQADTRLANRADVRRRGLGLGVGPLAQAGRG